MFTALHHRRHQPGKHRGGQRLEVEGGDLALVLHASPALMASPFARVGELPRKPAEHAAHSSM